LCITLQKRKIEKIKTIRIDWFWQEANILFHMTIIFKLNVQY